MERPLALEALLGLTFRASRRGFAAIIPGPSAVPVGPCMYAE